MNFAASRSPGRNRWPPPTPALPLWPRNNFRSPKSRARAKARERRRRMLLAPARRPSRPPIRHPEAVAMTISEHRKAIDKLDAQIVKLLNDRTTHVFEIGKLKLQAGGEIYAPQRELQVLQR